jgi:hypothetical protein
MKLEFGSDTLGDDAATPRRTIAVNSLAGEALVQRTALAGGANPFLKGRGNVSGRLAFTVTNVFASYDLANAFIPAEYARLGVQDDLVWTRATDLFTFDEAVLAAVNFQLFGVTVYATYTFEVTTVTLTEPEPAPPTP